METNPLVVSMLQKSKCNIVQVTMVIKFHFKNFSRKIKKSTFYLVQLDQLSSASIIVQLLLLPPLLLFPSQKRNLCSSQTVVKIIDHVPCGSSYAFIILICDLYTFGLPRRTSKPILIPVIYSMEKNILVSF